MPRVTISRSAGQDGYAVKVTGRKSHATHDRVFLWGDFDDCTISWQAARAQAERYARDVAKSLRGTVHKSV